MHNSIIQWSCGRAAISQHHLLGPSPKESRPPNPKSVRHSRKIPWLMVLKAAVTLRRTSRTVFLLSRLLPQVVNQGSCHPKTRPDARLKMTLHYQISLSMSSLWTGRQRFGNGKEYTLLLYINFQSVKSLTEKKSLGGGS